MSRASLEQKLAIATEFIERVAVHERGGLARDAAEVLGQIKLTPEDFLLEPGEQLTKARLAGLGYFDVPPGGK